MAASVEPRDDEWLVKRAKVLRRQDPYAARSWLVVARTLFPRNFSIQFEMYQLEKSSRNIQELVRLLEEMLSNFPSETLLWTEILLMTDVLQSDRTDENAVFLRDIFTSLAEEMQCRALLRVAELSSDVLQQCRLLLLIVERYPSHMPDQGEKLVESLLQAEKFALLTSPVNPYRRYLACSVLPLLLRSGQQKPSARNLCRWLRKAVEYCICFIAQKSSKANSSDSTDKKPFCASNANFAPAFENADCTLSSFSGKDGAITDPWHQLFQLINAVADDLQWNIGRLFSGDSLDSQWHQIFQMSEGLRTSRLDPGQLEILTNQVLLCTAVLFVHCLRLYSEAVDSHSGSSGQTLQGTHHAFVLVEFFQTEPSSGNELKSKRLKAEESLPKIFFANKILSLGRSEDVVHSFQIALNCWHLLNSPLLENEFKVLSDGWSADKWPWLFRFETDVLLYQGYYREIISRLQPIQSAQCSPVSRHRQMSLQLACCYYSTSNYMAVVDMVLYIIGTLSSGSMQGHEALGPPQVKGRQLFLMPLIDSEVFSCCVHLLVACLKDKVWKANAPGEVLATHGNSNGAQLDTLLGHMMVLMQHDWPKYEPMMCKILEGIKRQGCFSYCLFFNYIINIDLLEEFAYLRTPEGGRVTLDILQSSSAKSCSQSRTVTRGVNKGVKEDFKAAMDRQVARTEENISLLLRTFIVDEADFLTKSLL